MSAEIWKSVKGWPYQVSSSGNIRRIGSIVNRKLYLDAGYYRIDLCNCGAHKRFPVHRLVVAAFHGPFKKALHVNHKNGIKTDNRPENLETCTNAENIAHATRMGLRAYGARNAAHLYPERRPHGASHGRAKLDDDKVRGIRKALALGASRKSVAALYSVGRTTIDCIIRREKWAHVK